MDTFPLYAGWILYAIALTLAAVGKVNIIVLDNQVRTWWMRLLITAVVFPLVGVVLALMGIVLYYLGTTMFAPIPQMWNFRF